MIYILLYLLIAFIVGLILLHILHGKYKKDNIQLSWEDWLNNTGYKICLILGCMLWIFIINFYIFYWTSLYFVSLLEKTYNFIINKFK